MAVITLRQFVKELGNVVQKTKAQRALSIAKGSISNMEQYHRQCGQVEGMENTVALARDMLSQLESAEDESGLPEMTT